MSDTTSRLSIYVQDTETGLFLSDEEEGIKVHRRIQESRPFHFVERAAAAGEKHFGVGKYDVFITRRWIVPGTEEQYPACVLMRTV
jgi:hypothetical protein